MTAPENSPELVAAKQELRARLRAARRERRASSTPETREREATAVATAAVEHAEARGALTVTAYEATPTEPPTEAMVRALVSRGIRVLLPRTLPDLDLDWQEVLAVAPPTEGATAAPAGSADPAAPTAPTTPITPGASPAAASPYTLGQPLGTDAIALADVVFTPGLAVDHGGRRLGQGGGCYDRALPRRSAHAPVVTIVHDAELVEGPLPVGELDEPVEAALTPARGVVDLPLPQAAGPADAPTADDRP